MAGEPEGNGGLAGAASGSYRRCTDTPPGNIAAGNAAPDRGMRTHDLHNASPSPPITAGDFVRLRRDEPGEFVTARAGDWGQVARVNRDSTVDLMLAGYCRPRTSPQPRANAIPLSIVERCDAFGRVDTTAPRRRAWGTGDAD